MESNVVSLSDFRLKKKTNSTSLMSDNSLAIKSELVQEQSAIEFDFETLTKLEIFKIHPEFRFVIEDGYYENEDEEFLGYMRVRMKGTEISGHGDTEMEAWMDLSVVLKEEGML